MMDLYYDPECIVNNLDRDNWCSCTETSSCRCGEESGEYEWAWDTSFKTPVQVLDEKNLEVKFHPDNSVCTAAVRGDTILSKGRHHYWEVKMITPVFGTDVMVGVGTNKAALLSSRDDFCSLLGRDSQSWGYSYKGYIQHSGQTQKYTAGFKLGSLVGVHLDSWRGTLQFFLNRKPLGIAFTGLRGLELYPMVCSTTAKSKMRITCSCSMPASLQTESLLALRPNQRAYMQKAFPGLKYLSQSILSDVLRKNSGDDDEYDEYENLILDEFDFALVGCQNTRKRKRL